MTTRSIWIQGKSKFYVSGGRVTSLGTWIAHYAMAKGSPCAMDDPLMIRADGLQVNAAPHTRTHTTPSFTAHARRPAATGRKGALASVARGTLILTANGPERIETLAPGDLVMTQDAGPQPLVAVRQIMLGVRQPHPISVAPGALGRGLPWRHITMSACQRLHVEGLTADLLFGEPDVFVAASDMVNDATIMAATDASDLPFFQLVFDRHYIIWAEGAALQSVNPAALAKRRTRRTGSVAGPTPDARDSRMLNR